MNVHTQAAKVQQTSNDYGIRIDPIEGQVSAWRNDVCIARSDRAKIMHETRLDSVVYFPPEDILVPLFDDSELRTFCPFKGTATYFDMDVEGERTADAAWSYRKVLPEGEGVEGYIAFLPDSVTRIDVEGVEPASPFGGHIAGPTVDWLMREASTCRSPEELTAAIARKFVEDGIAVSRLSIMIWSLHPLIAGKNYIWSRDTDSVAAYSPDHGLLNRATFIDSPLRHVSNGLGGVRQRLDVDEYEFSFPILEDLKASGATDYVAMPLPFSNGQINVMTLTCDHPKGFTTPNLGLVFECSAVISRFFEVFTLQDNAKSLLETYLGKRTGARVLGGEIRRGDGDEIDAAILFCDLRGSSILEDQLDRDSYIALLNTFFETTTDIINAHDGEVLKFIGDAVLAIFPAGDDRAKACRQALDSAVEIARQLAKSALVEKSFALESATGIAFGKVTYGNIGSLERLDFTVIGKAANIAARLGDYGKVHGHAIVASKDVIADPSSAQPLGLIELRNVSEPVETFAVST